MEPSIVVLAKTERAVKSTLSFLERRGTPVKFVSSLNEAIEIFTKQEANILLFSVNFPNPKIEMIPALILQSFSVPSIAFAEETDRKTSQKLQSVKTRHVIMGPVSGPAVMMKVRQIEKDLEGGGDASPGEGAARGSMAQEAGDQSINVRGGSALAAKQEALNSLMSAARETSGDDEMSLLASGETYVDKGQRSKAHRAKYQRAHREANYHDGLSDEDRALSALQSVEPILARRKSGDTPEEDLFLKCMGEAIEAVVGEPSDYELCFPILKKAMLVAIRSRKMKGAFVIAVGQSKHKPADIMQRIQVAFFSLLRANGIELDASEEFSSEIEHVYIANDAISVSPHLLMAQTPEAQVGLAVVMTEDPVPSLQPYERNMLQVPLSDLPAEEPVNFNVYLHLRRNGKFIRYLRVGSALSNKQVVRLTKHNITHVLVDGAEREAYSRHYAAHSIQPSKRRRSA